VLAACSSLVCCRAYAQDLSDISEAKPFTISGSLSIQGQHFHSPGSAYSERPDLTGYLFFSPTIGIYGIELPFSVYLTTNQTQFRQPFNEFGVSPRYKSITAHLGYRSVQYSQYTLASERWLGVGGDLRLPVLRLSAMYGRFKAAAEEDTTIHAPRIYKRTGYAFKVGFGNDGNYVDLNYFHGRDDSASLPAEPVPSTVHPSENVVLGLLTHFGLFEGAITVDGEIAGSVFTRDLSAPEIDLTDVPDFARNLMAVNSSTRFNLAMRGSIGYSSRPFRLSLKYERVEPDFESMGVGYITGDHEDITVAPMLNLIRELRLSGSIGIRRNNLLDTRLTTTHRLISSAGIAWQPSVDFGIDARYSNYSTNSTDGRIRVTDTTRIENVSQMISIAPRYTFGPQESRHTFSLLLMRQIYDDRNILTGALTNNNSTNVTLTYSTMLDEFGINASTGYSRSESATYQNTVYNVSGGVTKDFFEKSLFLSLNASLTSARTSAERSTQIFPAVSASYRLTENDSFTLNSQASFSSRSNTLTREFNSSLGYTRTF
jgi:hypothetical protein